MNHENLLNFLYSDIPKSSEKTYGFLDIIGKVHDENINTRLYGYFFNESQNPLISKVFLQSLLKIIKEKCKREFSIESYNTILEDYTKKGNRIDLVLLQSDKEKVIIIENKIYHTLNNDLSDYWNNYESINNENKVGILLTLFKHSIPEEVKDKFINITHFELISEIKRTGIPFDIQPRTYIYLLDFFNAITSLSNFNTMDELTKFYFKHSSKIQEVIQTSNSAINYIKNEIQKTAEALELNTYGNSNDWRNIWDASKRRKTFYTITFKGFLNGTDENYIIIEMEHEDVQYANEFKKVFFNDPDLNKLEMSDFVDNNRMHLVSKKMEISFKSPENLSDYLVKEIQDNFEPIMTKLLAFIDEKKKNNV